MIGGEGIPQEGHMAELLPPPVGPQEVIVHGHTTVEHEEESGAGHSTATCLVDRDPQAAKGLHHHQLVFGQNRVVHPHTAHLRRGGREGGIQQLPFAIWHRHSK